MMLFYEYVSRKLGLSGNVLAVTVISVPDVGSSSEVFRSRLGRVARSRIGGACM